MPPWGGRVYGFSARASFAYLLIQSNVWRWRGGWCSRPAPTSKGVRPNKSARPRNTAVTTAAAGKMRSQSLHLLAIKEFAYFLTMRPRCGTCTKSSQKNGGFPFNCNAFHRKARASGTTLETGMRATDEGT